MARLNTDGSVDTNFLPVNLPSQKYVDAIAVQGDQKVLIGGAFSTVNDMPRGNLARLNTDGSLDTGFAATGSGANSNVEAIVVQSDGKIIIGGGFSGWNGTLRWYVARLDPAAGDLDATFTPGTGPDDTVYALALQSDGKILVGGMFDTFSGASRGGIARLNANGTLDSTFVTPGTGFRSSTMNYVDSIAVQQDGRILIAGYFADYNGTTRANIARLNADGSLDTGFRATGAGPDPDLHSVMVLNDGKIFIGGEFSTYDGSSWRGVARLWP